ncbi:MAG: biotin synthase BioB [Spirochaetia bacterium]|nr:biotin synthase BioB [Spirochaetia bacterium]
MERAIDGILEKSIAGGAVTRAESLALLEAPDSAIDKMIEAAFAVRKKYRGLKVAVQILSNAKSGNCSQDCSYCAQSNRSKAAIEKYPLVPYEKLSLTGKLVAERNLSRHCIGLSGIRFGDEEIDRFAGYVRQLKEQAKTSICCSIGFLTEDQARKLKEAGVDRINHNLNTSRAFYPQICTTHTFDERVANIKMLQAIGFEICSGGIVGLGEGKHDVADMFFELKSIAPQSVPINFLLPLEGTALEGANISHLTAEYCLKVLCLARLMLGGVSLRCAAGREVYFKGQEKNLFKIVDSIFASGYLTADGQNIDDTINLVEAAGFESYIE